MLLTQNPHRHHHHQSHSHPHISHHILFFQHLLVGHSNKQTTSQETEKERENNNSNNFVHLHQFISLFGHLYSNLILVNFLVMESTFVKQRITYECNVYLLLFFFVHFKHCSFLFYQIMIKLTTKKRIVKLVK